MRGCESRHHHTAERAAQLASAGRRWGPRESFFYQRFWEHHDGWERRRGAATVDPAPAEQLPFHESMVPPNSGAGTIGPDTTGAGTTWGMTGATFLGGPQLSHGRHQLTRLSGMQHLYYGCGRHTHGPYRQLGGAAAAPPLATWGGQYA